MDSLEKMAGEELSQVMKSHDSRIKFISGLAAGLICFILIYLILVGLSIYRYNWSVSLFEKTAIALPYPAMKINSFWVTYKDYQKIFVALKNINSRQGGMIEENLARQTREQTIDFIIKNILVEPIAAEYGVSINAETLAAAYKELTDLQGGQEKIEKYIQEWYFMTPAEYQKYFLKPGLLLRQLSQKIVETEPANLQTQNQAMAILNQLRNKEKSFEDLAKEYSRDQFAATGGEVGYVPKGFFPSDIEETIFALEIGQYTDVLSLSDSYQIIKVLGRDENEGLVKIARIYLPIIDLSDLLTEAQAKTPIDIYIK